MSTETHLVFVNLDTDTVEDLAHDVFVIDPNATTISDADREILETADHFGTFTDEAREIVRRVGVPFADLWSAYRREQQRAGDGWRWRADRGGWTHCNDRADYDDDGVTCRKCYRFISHDDAAVRMIE